MLTGLLISGTAQAEQPLHELDNAAIEARIRATFGDADPFAAAKTVGLMFADTVDMNNAAGHGAVSRDAVLTSLQNDSLRVLEQMPDFHITERDLYVSDDGVVMTGRMMGTHSDGSTMDTAFVTVFTRDGSGRIVKQSTLESPTEIALAGAPEGEMVH
jgi:hypothetical protein